MLEWVNCGSPYCRKCTPGGQGAHGHCSFACLNSVRKTGPVLSAMLPDYAVVSVPPQPGELILCCPTLWDLDRARPKQHHRHRRRRGRQWERSVSATTRGTPSRSNCAPLRSSRPAREQRRWPSPYTRQLMRPAGAGVPFVAPLADSDRIRFGLRAGRGGPAPRRGSGTESRRARHHPVRVSDTRRHEPGLGISTLRRSASPL